MQILSDVSKYLILAVLSCSLVIALYSGNKNITAYNEPVEEAVSVAQPETIWSTISSEFELDHKVQSAQVQREIRRLVADHEGFNKILRAAAPYIYFIHEQTRAYGLPAELALIPFIESEYNPNDRSNKGALGLWQLMRGTAHDLGVKVKSGYDGRKNVIDSTNAALAYFRDLGNNFRGNWMLAIAAYNCGEGRVHSAVRRAGTESFFNIGGLPKETKFYVPRLLAVAAIIENPEKYGVELPQTENQPYFEEVTINKSVNISTVAKSAGINAKKLTALNPDNQSGRVSKEKPLLVPRENLPDVKSHLEKTKVLVA